MRLKKVMTILYGERQICDLLVRAIVDLFSCYSEREQISVKSRKHIAEIRSMLNVMSVADSQ